MFSCYKTQNIFMRIVNSSLYKMMDMAVFIYDAKKEIYENAACSSENHTHTHTHTQHLLTDPYKY